MERTNQSGGGRSRGRGRRRRFYFESLLLTHFRRRLIQEAVGFLRNYHAVKAVPIHLKMSDSEGEAPAVVAAA